MNRETGAPCARGTRHTGQNEFYPVAKSNMNGSGSNKFCLAKFVRRAHDGSNLSPASGTNLN